MIRRLRIKFVCINMLIVTVMLGMIFGLVLHFTVQNLERQSMQMLRTISTEGMPRIPREGGQRIARIPHIEVNTDRSGNVISTAGSLSDIFREQIPELVRLVLDSESSADVLSEYQLRYHKTVAPFGFRIVFADISAERTMILDLVQSCLAIGAVSFAVFLLISILLAHWAIRPVETAWIRQRQFIADASHELKTPLTVILTNAELLQDQAQDTAARQQFADSILTMCHQMRGLVERLLELARVDNGAVKTVFTEFDLSGLTEDCLLPFEPVFFEKGIRLESSVEPGIRIRGSEAHIRQVVDILLDNAAKYSEPEEPVRISLHRQGFSCILCVAGKGKEISREDLKNIFKRFYRIDKARSMNQSYGLGLSIAESIVLEHHGKIWAQSSDGRNRFSVQLPVLHSGYEKKGIK